jgi:acetyl esterase/lipase
VFIDPEISAAVGEFPIDFGQLDPESLLLVRELLGAAPPPELSDQVERADRLVPAAGDSPDVAVTVHRPKSGGSGRGVVWMHGGGLVLGSREMDDARFDAWCTRFDMVAVAVEYRLAPETPYPGPLEDCYDALRWVHEDATDLGVSRDAIGIGGVSAGGGLAAALALLARDRGELPVAWQALIYPMLDDRQQTASSQWDAPIWPPAANDFGWRAYLGEAKGGPDVPAYAAAARVTDLGGLPPTLITVGGADGFLDENVDYAMRLTHAGVETELRVYPGATHGFDSIAPHAGVTQRAKADIEVWLTRQLALA